MSIINQISAPISSVVPAISAPAPSLSQPDNSQYFYKKLDNGSTIGASDQKDVMGRPFFAFRKPGDTSTTTDMTRTATTFDPTVPQPLTKDQYYDPRAADLRQQLLKTLNIQKSEQLDHKIALAVGGSNDPSNLRAIPSEENQAEGKYEYQLAKDVATGKVSYLHAQVLDAQNKGIPVPWTPDGYHGDSAWEKFESYVGSTFSAMKKYGSYTDNLSKLLLGDKSQGQ